MMHPSRGLLAFADGETRMIFAKRISDGTLFRLPDGEANALRVWTTESLMCPVPGCELPKLTTVSRRDHRDGFRHFPGAGKHEPESVFHQQGKAAVASWLSAKHPASIVGVEVALDAQRTRIADVMIEAASGARGAFEIQYASLRVSDWEARHKAYVAAGVSDVWMFGHHGSHMKPAGAEVKVLDVHRAVVAAGQWLVWLNPLRGELAVATRSATYRGKTIAVPYRRGSTAELVIAPISEFWAGPNGLDGTVLRGLSLNRDLVQAELEQAKRVAVVAAPRAAPRFMPPRAAYVPLPSPTKRSIVVSAEAHDRWAASERHVRVLAFHGGEWPIFLSAVTKQTLIVPGAEWQSWIFHERLVAADVDSVVNQLDLARAVAQEFEPGAPVSIRIVMAVEEWLDLLVARKSLRRIDAPRRQYGKKRAHAVYLRNVWPSRWTPSGQEQVP